MERCVYPKFVHDNLIRNLRIICVTWECISALINYCMMSYACMMHLRLLVIFSSVPAILSVIMVCVSASHYHEAGKKLVDVSFLFGTAQV